MLRLIVRDLLVPGSIPFLLLAMVAGMVALYIGPRAHRLGRIWLTALLGCYWLMSTSISAGWLEDWIDGDYTPLDATEAAADIDAVVVLSGGGNTFRSSGYEINTPGPHTAFRTLETIRLHNMIPEALLILSGGIGDPHGLAQPESEIMRSELLRAGVPESRIALETKSRNTQEQALNVAAMLRKRDIDSFVLVTSAAHMRRALGTFRAQGLAAVPSVASTISTEMQGGQPWHRAWLPSEGALYRSRSVMRETLAIVYYQQQGWLEREP